MAGEILKGTVNIALNNPTTGKLANVDLLTQNIPDVAALTSILANPGKAFNAYQVTFDPAVAAINVAATINDRINQWISSEGPRYDDIQVIINTSGVATHDITIIIVRNFERP